MKATGRHTGFAGIPSPEGAPKGFHGCEMEVTVDTRSQRMLGYSLSNLGWSTCGDLQRKIRIAAL